MLESVTILSKGGLVLYQHLGEASSSSSTKNQQQSAQQDTLNRWLEDVYLDPTRSESDNRATLGNASTTATTTSTATKLVVEWEESSSLICVAIYPDIVAFPWVPSMLQSTLEEYQIFIQSQQSEGDDHGDDENRDTLNVSLPMPPTDQRSDLFDSTFQVLLKTHKTNKGGPISSLTSSFSGKNQKGQATKSTKPGKGGKEKRHWHDGKAKVTKEAMAELDFSKATTDEAQQEAGERALADARAAYLPTDTDLSQFQVESTVQIDDEADEDSEQGWGNSLSSLFQQMTGQKVLTKQDLQGPIKEIHKMLTSKNVASDIADQICDKVEAKIVGKKLNSMYRVKTAVRQALESVIDKLLEPSMQLDLIRRVVSKRDALFGKKKPFVICVVGINGVGKSTSLAKIAYHLKTHGGCNPLLAACDTFRSGAVEQLSMHAKCLDVPIFAKGYSKDPSSVAQAAVEQAMQDKNDVVLIDTAGRMQNNVPLMKALGKLVSDNQPDLTVFVGEALVGNDGVDQVRMFNQAVSTYGRNRKIDAILLTKFDTVSDKVGAALTMTHVTNAPILFVGTGQKYHHLQKLSTRSVIQSLFR